MPRSYACGVRPPRRPETGLPSPAWFGRVSLATVGKYLGDCLRQRKVFFALIAILSAATASRAVAVDCVQYVKFSSSFGLSWNAWSWWQHAAGVYDRSNEPRAGAVLVFERTRRMPAGHVALVSRVVDDYTVLID